YPSLSLCLLSSLALSLRPPPPISPLFPYTTLFRSIYSPFKNFLLQYTQFYLISQRNLQNNYKFFTLATTFSTVKPYSSTTLSPFAEAPKQSIASTSPSKPV